jgi:hypothetical protein
MYIRRLVRWFSAFALVPSALTGACTVSPGTPEEAAESGTLELPLLSSTNGHTYWLTGYMYVSGPSFSYVDLSGDSQVLSLPLSTGDYAAQLYSWTLLRDDGSGTFIPVTAALLSSSYVPFSIYHGAKTTLTFEFETDGVVVQVGAGTLDVRVDVNETAAVCTPFASDCGEGAWCPPSGLTGASRECVPAGELGDGEPCAGPFDCAADSSCFDFGQGPVCADLCDPSGAGVGCSPDAECVPVDSEFGVCTPSDGGE